MNQEWLPYIVAAAAALYFAWKKRDAIKEALGGVLPATAKADPTTERVLLALQLRAACDKACPEAIKHIDAAIPHLLPGHVEGAK